MADTGTFQPLLAALVVCSAVGAGVAPAVAQSDGPTPTFEVFLAAETVAKTYLGSVIEGDTVNLERALAADGRFDGIVTLSVTYVGLAAVADDTLTVTEPFASGFEPDRRFVVTAPDGYAVAAATPAADTSGDARVVYDAGTHLSGFELVLEPTGTPSPTETPVKTMANTDEPSDGGTDTGGQPGFGAVAAALALVAAALVAVCRR